MINERRGTFVKHKKRVNMSGTVGRQLGFVLIYLTIIYYEYINDNRLSVYGYRNGTRFIANERQNT